MQTIITIGMMNGNNNNWGGNIYLSGDEMIIG